MGWPAGHRAAARVEPPVGAACERAAPQTRQALSVFGFNVWQLEHSITTFLPWR
jgi:hypothetical protein